MYKLSPRFFIPDVEYLQDPEGLIAYVEEKVKLGFICLYCNGKGKTFHTYRAVQQVCEGKILTCRAASERTFFFVVGHTLVLEKCNQRVLPPLNMTFL